MPTKYTGVRNDDAEIRSFHNRQLWWGHANLNAYHYRLGIPWTTTMEGQELSVSRAPRPPPSECAVGILMLHAQPRSTLPEAWREICPDAVYSLCRGIPALVLAIAGQVLRRIAMKRMSVLSRCLISLFLAVFLLAAESRAIDFNRAGPRGYQPPCYDPPCYDPPCYDPPCYDPPCYDPPCYDPPCYDPPCCDPPCCDPPCCDPPCCDPPCWDPPCCDPPCYDPPCYDPPCYDPPCCDPPCNDGLFLGPFSGRGGFDLLFSYGR